MAQDYNSDVDRAMAAFAALPMPYSNFGTASAGLGHAVHGAGNDGATRQVEGAGQAVAFPLLTAALPGFKQSLAPVPPSVSQAVPERPRAVLSEAKRGAPAARAPRAPDRIVPQPPEMMSYPEQRRTLPDLSATFGLPARHAPAEARTQPVPVPHAANPRTTPIAAMFQALHATDPTRVQSEESGSGLQDIFSRL